MKYIFFQKIRKELIDARVVEGHIVPNRLLFTSHAPSPEYPTVAWLPDAIQAIPTSLFQRFKKFKIILNLDLTTSG